MNVDIPRLAKARILIGAMRQQLRFGLMDLVAYGLCRGRVGGGNFRGMVYPVFFFNTAVAMKLIGMYEWEIGRVVAWSMASGFGRFVNIGAAEGYYAVGVARGCPTVRVDTFETEARKQRALHKMAGRNGVQDRIVQHGRADAAGLRGVLAGAGEIFLLVDIEGGEWELLDPVAVPEFLQAWILAELHPFVHGDIGEILRGRFADSHELFWFEPRGGKNFRARSDWTAAFHWLARFESFCVERRGWKTPWLLMKPRASKRPFDIRAVEFAIPSKSFPSQ